MSLSFILIASSSTKNQDWTHAATHCNKQFYSCLSLCKLFMLSPSPAGVKRGRERERATHSSVTRPFKRGQMRKQANRIPLLFDTKNHWTTKSPLLNLLLPLLLLLLLLFLLLLFSIPTISIPSVLSDAKVFRSKQTLSPQFTSTLLMRKRKKKRVLWLPGKQSLILHWDLTCEWHYTH